MDALTPANLDTQSAAPATAPPTAHHITLVSSIDGGVVEFPRSLLAGASGMIKSVLEIDDTTDKVPLNVKSGIFDLILKWLQINEGATLKELPRPITSINLRKLMSEDNAVFFENLTRTQLYELIVASQLLDIAILYNYSCGTVASLLKRKTEQTIRDILSDKCKDMLIKDIKTTYETGAAPQH